MNNKEIKETGYSPSITNTSNSYSNKGYYETSAAKNTISEITKNKTIIIDNSIKKLY